MKIKCMIVDDEPLAIEVLKSHIEKIEMLEVTVCCQNAFEAFEWLNRKKIDLLFLDIQMPGMKGTDFLRNIKNPPRVILTTAYRDYALEGYELDVLDYLVKPVSFERFFKAVNKLLHPPHETGTIAFKHPETPSEGFIYVKVNKKIHKILLSDILYTDSLKDYITIHTPTGNITAKHTLTAFEEMLPENEFLRIHRSFIVSIKKITGFTASTVEIAGNELPIGRNYRQHVFKVLNYAPLKDI
jgi:two-component system LytT family response regulator